MKKNYVTISCFFIVQFYPDFMLMFMSVNRLYKHKFFISIWMCTTCSQKNLTEKTSKNQRNIFWQFLTCACISWIGIRYLSDSKFFRSRRSRFACICQSTLSYLTFFECYCITMSKSWRKYWTQIHSFPRKMSFVFY